MPRVKKQNGEAASNGDGKVKKERKPRAVSSIPRKARDPASMKLRKVGGHPPDTRIVMGTDGDGRNYSATNNPKRPGTKAAEWFTRYKNNATMAQVVAAGVPPGDILWNLERKFIEIAT